MHIRSIRRLASETSHHGRECENAFINMYSNEAGPQHNRADTYQDEFEMGWEQTRTVTKQYHAEQRTDLIHPAMLGLLRRVYESQNQSTSQ